MSERKIRIQKLMRAICQYVAISLSCVKTLFITGWLGLEAFQKYTIHVKKKKNRTKKHPPPPNKCSPPQLYIFSIYHKHLSGWETCSLDLISRRCTSHRKRPVALHNSLEVEPPPEGLHLRRAGLWSLIRVQLVPHHQRTVPGRSVLPDLTLPNVHQAYCCICKSFHQLFWQFRFTRVFPWPYIDNFLWMQVRLESVLFPRESTLSSALHQMQGWNLVFYVPLHRNRSKKEEVPEAQVFPAIKCSFFLELLL